MNFGIAFSPLVPTYLVWAAARQYQHRRQHHRDGHSRPHQVGGNERRERDAEIHGAEASYFTCSMIFSENRYPLFGIMLLTWSMIVSENRYPLFGIMLFTWSMIVSDALLSQPLEQRRDMNLVRLVVAGQRVHHDVDAGPEGEFALARIAARERQHVLPVVAHRPGACEII